MCSRAQMAKASPSAKSASPIPARREFDLSAVIPKGPDVNQDDHDDEHRNTNA